MRIAEFGMRNSDLLKKRLNEWLVKLVSHRVIEPLSNSWLHFEVKNPKAPDWPVRGVAHRTIRNDIYLSGKHHIRCFHFSVSSFSSLWLSFWVRFLNQVKLPLTEVNIQVNMILWTEQLSSIELLMANVLYRSFSILCLTKSHKR